MAWGLLNRSQVAGFRILLAVVLLAFAAPEGVAAPPTSTPRRIAPASQNPRTAAARMRRAPAARTSSPKAKTQLLRAAAQRRYRQSLRRATALVVDLDNTVVDTRPRTLAALHKFARGKHSKLSSQQRARLLKSNVGDVGFDAEETASKLGLNQRQARDFEQLWRQEFWTPANLKHDVGIPKTLALIAKAHAKGTKIYFLTGRQRHFTKDTIAQLRRIGVAGFDKSRLWLKPAGQDTPSFKLDKLRQLAANGEKVVFIDDARANIRAVQRAKLPVESVAVDFPVNQRNAARLRANTASFDPGL